MHPFSILTLGIFVAGYITARWDLVTRLYELAIFAWDHGVVVCFVLLPVPSRNRGNRTTDGLTSPSTIDTDRQGFPPLISILLPSRTSYQSYSCD